MATSFNRFSNSASVASAPVVSSLDATIANAVANNQLVFKLELNANPSKVLTAKADGKYESTITNLGGCGAMRRNNKTGLVFFSVNSRPMIKDKTLGHVVNLPVSGSLVENHVNSEKLAALLFAVYGANSAMLYFNDNRKDVFFDEDLQEIMASESGLLTVFFALDETSVSPELIDVYGVPTPRLNCKIIAANFEAGKATYIPQPRNVAPAFRLAKGLAILNEQYDSNFNAHGNLELSESFFAGIESKRDEFLAGIGTGKKAHQQFKKALQESVDAGNWNKDAEYKLYAIARRGTNPHYSMKNHDAFVAQLRAQVGDDVVIIEAATPVAVETKVEAMATILESAAAAVEDDEEDDYGFVATVNPSAFLSSASQASDLEINI